MYKHFHGDQAQMVAHASLELSPSKRLGRPDTVSLLQVPASTCMYRSPSNVRLGVTMQGACEFR
jgi:hypothetical protein